jgi:hypothetical protein
MKRLAIAASALAAVTMLSQMAALRAADRFAGTAAIDYFGYPDCIKLENQQTRVVLCPHGGRVLEYSLQGKNSLYLDPNQKGWMHERGKPAVDPCGGRFDIGPENIIPPHPNLWLGKWAAEIIGPRASRLTSVKDEATGTQLVREFRLDESSSKLTCTQTITNVSQQPIRWCHWSRTLAQGGGICIIPLSSQSRFPHKYIMYGPGPVMNYRPQDANIRVRSGFLEVLGTPQQPKLGLDSSAGWLAYLTKNDLLLVKRFPTYPDRVYNEMAALTISIWYYKDLMCELEPIGPMEKLAPGAAASFTEEWWLLPQKFPEQGAQIDLEELARLVRQKASS